MKNQALFSSKDKSKNLKCRLLQFLSGTLKFNVYITKTSQQTNESNMPRRKNCIVTKEEYKVMLNFFCIVYFND